MRCEYSAKLFRSHRSFKFSTSTEALLEVGNAAGFNQAIWSADLMELDLRFRRYAPEGVVFQEAGLAKQTRQGKPRAEYFFPAFSQTHTSALRRLYGHMNKRQRFFRKRKVRVEQGCFWLW